MAAHTFSFYSPGLAATDSALELVGEEHHHLYHVLRMRHGEHMRVTNGRGLIVSAQVESIDNVRTTARVTRVEANEREAVPLVLALGLLPRGPMELALSQCIEAGITGWLPVITERGHVRRSTERSEERWNRIAVAAMKQSGRAWLPSIEAPLDSKKLSARFQSFTRVVLADAEASASPGTTTAPEATLAIVGPEAGFTDAERSLFIDAGAKPVRLSAHRLRAETAAVVLVSLLALNRR